MDFILIINTMFPKVPAKLIRKKFMMHFLPLKKNSFSLSFTHSLSLFLVPFSCCYTMIIVVEFTCYSFSNITKENVSADFGQAIMIYPMTRIKIYTIYIHTHSFVFLLWWGISIDFDLTEQMIFYILYH